MIDLRTEFGQHVAERLEKDCIIWLITVRHDLIPQPAPVWFLWNGESFLIYTRPDAQKLRNIHHNPLVALHLDGKANGEDIVIFWGKAVLDNPPSAPEIKTYMAKYAQGMVDLHLTSDERMATGAYNTAIRVYPTHLLGY